MMMLLQNMTRKFVAGLMLVILFSGCTNPRVVQEGDVIGISYTGKFLNGTVFDSGAFSFTVGSGQVIKGFDDGVRGMRSSESRTLTVPPEKAYGEYSNFSATAPFDVINSTVFNTVGINANVGVLVYVLRGDEQILTVITSIEGDTVELLEVKEHPLQGETLIFDVSVNSIE
jgi:peptidylprolyl isomerase